MKATYFATRFVLLRLLGFVYFVAFVSIDRQIEALLGDHGLLPARDFLARTSFVGHPSFFFVLGTSNSALHFVCITGAVLSLAVLVGLTNALAQLSLWALYMSIVHIGQTFYGFGWEMQLLETGFLSVFLCPVRTWRPLPPSPPPVVVIWLFRWLIVRIMLGAGLIKLRGDPCWTDLTCLVYHYETQPIPSPISWLFFALPVWAHKVGALSNHVVELVAPLLVPLPRPFRIAAGGMFVGFQGILILSGNLAFLNWLTLVPAIACFDDRLLLRSFPAKVRDRVLSGALDVPSKAHRIASYVLLAVVGVLSLAPIANLFSPRQVMNTSFEPLHLVNTYGAFGSVGRIRHEVILEGTRDVAIDEHTQWHEYEFPCKPGDVMRRPCLVTPYHYRVDWQIWFAAMSTYDDEPWLVHLVHLLLRGEPAVKSVLSRDPFPDAPPTWIRAELYRYEMTRLGETPWWRRTRVGEYMRPVRVDDPDLLDFIRAYGWTR
jgi:hypothetical protein